MLKLKLSLPFTPCFFFHFANFRPMRFLSVCSGEADVEITQLKRHLVCLKVVSIPRPGQLLTGADDGLCSSQDPSVHDLAHQEAVRLEKWRRLPVPGAYRLDDKVLNCHPDTQPIHMI